ncbi:VOC family protein [Salinicoccus sp. HZC-1]|uniref:VOC family protein n=1 Tax=Salinicoccus sp. HZC-1 TaxID=3385497 RepID=UPI00398B800C
MAVNPYLMFEREAKAAAELYESAFQTESAELMSYGEVPGEPYADSVNKNLIIHGKINVRGSEIMFSDSGSHSEITEGNNITVAVTDENLEYIRNAYNVLKDQGQVEMELQETFFAKGHAMLTDRFGIKWQLSCPDA